MKIISKSSTETAALAKKIAAQLHGGETLALIGDLGSGKTTFVKALARALGVRKPVRSPTFVLMVPYTVPRARNQVTENRGNLVTGQRIRWLTHVDAYRVNNARDLEAIGIREYLDRTDTVTVIEWADRVKTLLPKNKITVHFTHGVKDGERTISIIPPRGRLLPRW